MTTLRWTAETREDHPRFARRASALAIVRWAIVEHADRTAEVMVTSPSGEVSTLTYGGFWRTTDPDVIAVLDRDL